MNAEKYSMKLTYWTRLIREANSSGMSILDWCEKNQISKRQYYYWHKHVMQSTYRSLIDRGFQPPEVIVKEDETRPSEPVFAELTPPVAVPKPKSDDSGITLQTGDIRVCVDRGFSEEDLEKVMRVIGHVQ